MANMEFYRASYLNTTTMLAIAANQSDSAEFLIDKNSTVGFESVGYTAGTTLTLRLLMTAPKVMSHLIIQDHNIKEIAIYAETTTAAALYSSTSGFAFGSNTIISFASTTVSTLVIHMLNTTTEISIGELIASEKILRFERNPSIDRFSPFFDRKQVVHEMPDGGIVAYNIKDKYQARLGWEFLTSSFRDDLLSVYQSAQPVIFIPEPTTTAWDGNAFEAIWTGDFDFKHSTNDKEQGYSGNITLRQTPSR